MSHNVTFLVLVDGSDEMELALKFACMRASGLNARVALAYIIEPTIGDMWLSISKRTIEESRQDGEEVLKKSADLVYEKTGHMAISYMREGDTAEQFYDIMNSEDISFAVVASSNKGSGYDRVLSYLLKKGYNSLPVPLVIVPATITDLQLEALRQGK